ncbi:oxidoreductase [Cupriavidus sp. 2TAF22]|uniref:oxidoreductase n=1 Tax=unclassified Cupriavidus TaxID=2640874 RepID=UPI003F905458
MSRSATRVFLVTGVSSGFGRAISQAALADGSTVIGTVRNEADRVAFRKLAPGHADALVLDLTDLDAIGPAIQGAVERVGPVDVLVNNAGYGHEGTLEESSLEALVRQFEVNVFGAVAMIKAILPSMRARRTGHIFNITSMAGFAGLPGVPYYCGSKFALEGISESLAREVAGLGIKVTSVAPGSFRTDWAGRSMVRTDRSIADYDAVFEPIRRARRQKSGKQAGDPARAARILLDLVGRDDAPVHLLLGADALSLVRGKLAALAEEIDTWESVSNSTDFS